VYLELQESLVFLIMSVRKAFEDAWEAKFPDIAVPTNLSFLYDDGVSSLALALDGTERVMKKLEDELARQRFIYDFVLQRLNVSLAALSDSRRSVSPSRRGISVDERRKTPVSKTASAARASSSQPVRAQLAAVMAKIGIGKVNRPAIDPEDEGRLRSLDDSGRKATPVSRFYAKSNMYRASSEPSLLECDRRLKPQPAIPPTSTDRMPAGFKPIFTKDEHSQLTPSASAFATVNRSYKQDSRSPVTVMRKSTGSQLDYGRHKHTEEPVTRAAMYMETDLDSIIPPTTTPSPIPPPVERFKLDACDDVRPHRQRSHIYEELMEFRHGTTSKEGDEDEAVSSDEEPIYFNILLLKQQTLSRANALYTSGTDELASSSSIETEQEDSVQRRRRLRRMAHHYEHIEPQLTKPLTISTDTDSGKQIFILLRLFINMWQTIIVSWRSITDQLVLSAQNVA